MTLLDDYKDFVGFQKIKNHLELDDTKLLVNLPDMKMSALIQNAYDENTQILDLTQFNNDINDYNNKFVQIYNKVNGFNKRNTHKKFIKEIVLAATQLFINLFSNLDINSTEFIFTEATKTADTHTYTSFLMLCFDFLYRKYVLVSDYYDADSVQIFQETKNICDNMLQQHQRDEHIIDLCTTVPPDLLDEKKHTKYAALLFNRDSANAEFYFSTVDFIIVNYQSILDLYHSEVANTKQLMNNGENIKQTLKDELTSISSRLYGRYILNMLQNEVKNDIKAHDPHYELVIKGGNILKSDKIEFDRSIANTYDKLTFLINPSDYKQYSDWDTTVHIYDEKKYDDIYAKYYNSNLHGVDHTNVIQNFPAYKHVLEDCYDRSKLLMRYCVQSITPHVIQILQNITGLDSLTINGNMVNEFKSLSNHILDGRIASLEPKLRRNFYVESENEHRELNTTREIEEFIQIKKRNAAKIFIEHAIPKDYISSYCVYISSIGGNGFGQFCVYRCNLPVKMTIFADYNNGVKIPIIEFNVFGELIDISVRYPFTNKSYEAPKHATDTVISAVNYHNYVFRNKWKNTIPYRVNETVLYNNKLYVCIIGNIGVLPDPPNLLWANVLTNPAAITTVPNVPHISKTYSLKDIMTMLTEPNINKVEKRVRRLIDFLLINLYQKYIGNDHEYDTFIKFLNTNYHSTSVTSGQQLSYLLELYEEDYLNFIRKEMQPNVFNKYKLMYEMLKDFISPSAFESTGEFYRLGGTLQQKSNRCFFTELSNKLEKENTNTIDTMILSMGLSFSIIRFSYAILVLILLLIIIYMFYAAANQYFFKDKDKVLHI